MTTNMNTAAIEEIAILTGGTEVEFGGGGKGQSAWVWIEVADDETEQVVGRGTSRYAATVALLEALRARRVIEEAEQQAIRDEYLAPAVKAPRATIEQVIEQIRASFPDLDINEEDDDRAPGPVWQDHDGMPVLVAIVPCVGECMEGRSDVCDCRCLGANHGLGSFEAPPTWAEVKALQPVRFGPKECMCGCGGFTDRKFVPGHDARFHAAQTKIRRAAALGVTLDALADLDKQANRDKAKARRAARREARTAGIGASERTDA